MAEKMAGNFEGEAIGALIASPQSSPRRRRRLLQRMGNRRRRAGIGLETVVEEDPNLGSEIEDECCYVPTSRSCSYLSFHGEQSIHGMNDELYCDIESLVFFLGRQNSQIIHYNLMKPAIVAQRNLCSD